MNSVIQKYVEHYKDKPPSASWVSQKSPFLSDVLDLIGDNRPSFVAVITGSSETKADRTILSVVTVWRVRESTNNANRSDYTVCLELTAQGKWQLNGMTDPNVPDEAMAIYQSIGKYDELVDLMAICELCFYRV